jgi:hypothetical protein
MDQQSIRGLLQFTGTKIDKLTLVPNAKKEPTASLALTADLTPDLAEQMRCREAIFRADGKPHPHISRLDIDGILRDIELSLPHLDEEGTEFGQDVYSPEDIASFKVDVDGMSVRLSMLTRIKGRYLELVDFLAKINTERFDIAIRSRQQEFDWSGKVGGTKVDMSDGATVEGPLFHSADAETCILCTRGVPKNDEGRHITEDALVSCAASNEVEKQEVSGPVIPPMHATGSGRGPKQRNRRNFDPTAAEVEVEVVQ